MTPYPKMVQAVNRGFKTIEKEMKRGRGVPLKETGRNLHLKDASEIQSQM